jgi:hypothetical protein
MTAFVTHAELSKIRAKHLKGFEIGFFLEKKQG